MSASFPDCPASLKQIAHYLKTAQEHDTRDIVVAYWSRLHALQVGIKLSTKQPDENALLIAIMDWLENTKQKNHGNEAITNEVVAQAHMDNYAFKLFSYADQQDRASNFSKNVVKAFYSAGMIYDILESLGELSEESNQNRKYAKYKAAYIHNCLKNGETPIPGPLTEDGEAADGEADDNNDVVVGTAGEPAASGPAPGPVSPADTPAFQPPSNPSPPEGPHIGFKPPTTEYNPDLLPSPPVDLETRNPGGFQPYTGPAAPAPSYEAPTSHATLTADQMAKAQKYCKYAGSALNFDDVLSAIDNLQKALHLLTTGQERP